MQGTVVQVAAVGDAVHARGAVVVVESMKMEHSVEAGTEGTVAEVLVAVGEQIAVGDLVARIEAGSVDAVAEPAPAAGDGLRADLAEVVERHAVGHDDARPAAVAKRRTTGLRFEATDVPWSWGRGPTVRGPGEALLMTMLGRAQPLPELDGDALPVFEARVRG